MHDNKIRVSHMTGYGSMQAMAVLFDYLTTGISRGLGELRPLLETLGTHLLGHSGGNKTM